MCIRDRSKTFNSGPLDNSTWLASAPLVVLGYIATAGIQIVSLPAILIAPVLSPASTALACPVPLGAIVISPSAASVIVTVPEFVPELVLKTKSEAPPVVTVKVPAPFEVNVAAAPLSPTFTVSPARTTSPVPFGVTLISIFVSSPVDEIVGPAPVAAFAIVNSFTAELVAVTFANSAPLVSKIEVPIFGEVKVLFVKVSVDEALINPQSSISGFVPSLAVA